MLPSFPVRPVFVNNDVRLFMQQALFFQVKPDRIDRFPVPYCATFPSGRIGLLSCPHTQHSAAYQNLAIETGMTLYGGGSAGYTDYPFLREISTIGA